MTPWDTIGKKDRHGICLHIASLHSQHSTGIGDFLDLLPLLEWAKKIHLSIVQVLPLNDSYLDPSPYNPISSLALNPIYLNLPSLPYLDSSWLKRIEKLKQLNQTHRVEYRTVRKRKISFLKTYYQTFSFLFEKEVSLFVQKNPWVSSYALFCALIEKNKTYQWRHWPLSDQNPTQEHLLSLSKKLQKELSFYLFLQYLCDHQLSLVKKKADSLGLFLMGDLPFLICQKSHDAWAHRALFDLTHSVGAPPNGKQYKGQNWQFPPYHWDKMREENYAYWKLKLKVAEKYYHLFRMDHVMGFFRMWIFPRKKGPQAGHFEPKNPSSWEKTGQHFLQEVLRGSKMLPIAEDIYVAPCVHKVLHKLKIPGTRLYFWEQPWTNEKEFIPAQEFSRCNMITLATHDTPPLNLWWEEHPECAQIYAKVKKIPYRKKLSPKMRFAFLQDIHQGSPLFHINLLTEYLAFFSSLVHTDPYEERLNIPGTRGSKNWTYRFIPSIETLIRYIPLQKIMKKLCS